jgi:hypothetical protein
MVMHRILIEDGTTNVAAGDLIVPTITDMRSEEYEVVVPIFKRGRLWETGERIDLHPDTAARFIARGELKEVTDE